MRFNVCVLVACACSGAFASDPGQLLDCSDWVFLEPGYSCTTAAPVNCTSPACYLGTSLQTDNTGDTLFVRKVSIGSCANWGNINRTEIVRYDSQGEHVLGYIADRCSPWSADSTAPVSPGCYTFGDCTLTNSGPVLTFDDKNGRLLVPLNGVCSQPGCVAGMWLASINGFATTFEVLQTYTPTSASLAFRVPYLPEGMGGADHFDTYWGDLATVGDWSKAKGLQCSYPAAPPKVGDFFTVTDPLPTPGLGSGYYYVTAATYQGQTRYGRKSSGGKLTGRDPAVLPACVQP